MSGSKAKAVGGLPEGRFCIYWRGELFHKRVGLFAHECECIHCFIRMCSASCAVKSMAAGAPCLLQQMSSGPTNSFQAIISETYRHCSGRHRPFLILLSLGVTAATECPLEGGGDSVARVGCPESSTSFGRDQAHLPTGGSILLEASKDIVEQDTGVARQPGLNVGPNLRLKVYAHACGGLDILGDVVGFISEGVPDWAAPVLMLSYLASQPAHIVPLRCILRWRATLSSTSVAYGADSAAQTSKTGGC